MTRSSMPNAGRWGVVVLAVAALVTLTSGFAPPTERAVSLASGTIFLHGRPAAGTAGPTTAWGGVGRPPHAPAVDSKGELPITNLTLTGFISGLTVDPAKKEVFVAQLVENEGGDPAPGVVSVISEVDPSKIATVHVGVSPASAAYDSAKSEVFVANSYSCDVTVISALNNSTVATIPVNENPARECGVSGLAYDSANGEVFVTGIVNDTVYVIADSNNTLVGSIPVGKSPVSIVYDNATDQMFVANFGSQNVSVIDDSNDTVVATIPLGQPPEEDASGLAYDPRLGEIFVDTVNETCSVCNGNVSVISDRTDSVVGSVRIAGGLAGIAYDSATAQLLISAEPDLLILSDSTLATVGTVPFAYRHNPFSIAVEPGSQEVFVATDGVPGNLSAFSLGLWAGAAANQTSGPAHLAVGFRGLGFGGSWSYSSWSWTLGNGLTSTLQDPSTVYLQAGDYPVTLTVTDSTGAQVLSATLWINVSRPASFSADISATRTSVDVDEPIWVNTTTVGGNGPYLFAYNSTPSGAGCSASTGGSVECIPTVLGVQFAVGVQVTDSDGATENVTSAIISVDAPAFSVQLDVSNATPLLGESIGLSAAVSGGAGGDTYNFTGLPPGCLSVDRAYFGCLPTESGNYSAAVRVTDANGAVATSSVELRVTFDFTVSAPSETPTGHAFQIQVRADGGFGTLSYSYSGLPPGCASRNSPELTCTPSETGRFAIEVVIEDQAMNRASGSFVVNVVPPKPGFSLLGLPYDLGYVVVGGAATVALAALVLAVRTSSGLRTERDVGASDSYQPFRMGPNIDRPELPSPGLDSPEDPASDLF